MKETRSLRFLYNTVVGRCILWVLVRPWISKTAGCFLNSRFSRFLINPFVRKNQISLDEFDVPKDGFFCFNHFFRRSKLNVDFDETPENFTSPCDAFLTAYTIDENVRFNIKHTKYSVKDLLENRYLAKEYQGGTALIFRLTPKHYHRYHFADGGKVIADKRIDGVLHCVRPIAMDRYPIFIRNSREYTVIDTENFGRIIQMEVGALLVGKIYNHPDKVTVKRGEEKGYFEFGGSTVIVLVKKDVLSLSEELKSCVNNGEEISVSVGSVIGKKQTRKYGYLYERGFENE